MTNQTPAMQLADMLEAQRRSVFALCYRLTGSIEDAEDLTQETFLRATQSYERFEGRSSFRTWLHRIAANTSYNFLTAARRQREVALPDPLATTDEFVAAVAAERNEQSVRESMEYSFLCVLQELSPLQRLVVVLRDVLGWSVTQSAEALGTERAAVKNAHSRARKHLNARKRSGRAVPPGHPDAERVMQRFAETQVEGDIASCMALYRDDAEVYVFPSRRLSSSTDIREFHEELRQMPPRLFVGVRLNGSLGAACYHPTPDGKLARTGVVILEVVRDVWRSAARISRAYWIMEAQSISSVPTPTEMDPPDDVAARFVL